MFKNVMKKKVADMNGGEALIYTTVVMGACTVLSLAAYGLCFAGYVACDSAQTWYDNRRREKEEQKRIEQFCDHDD